MAMKYTVSLERASWSSVRQSNEEKSEFYTTQFLHISSGEKYIIWLKVKMKETCLRERIQSNASFNWTFNVSGYVTYACILLISRPLLICWRGYRAASTYQNASGCHDNWHFQGPAM